MASFTQLTSCLLLVSSVAAGILDPWRYVPPKRDWPAIIKSLEDVDHVKSYVRVYAAPFAQLQAAERSATRPPDVIKASTVAMLEMVHTACRTFNISEVAFEKHSKDTFRQALEDATSVFEGPNAQHLEPIYNIRSIRNFIFQRLDDMLVAAKKHQDFLLMKRNYEKHLEYAHRVLKNWESHHFKYVIPRNLDIDMVRKYFVEAISSRLDKKLESEDVDSLKWQLYSLGNDGTSLVASSILMTVPVIAAILMVA